MVKIRCVVERITYQNPENGYSVLKCRIKDYSDLVPVVGNLLDANVGSVLLAEGSWKVDAKYGRQFVAENWEETLPATVYGMEKYLGSGLIKGVGPKFAKRIVQRFGVDTFVVIEDNVELLVEVEGIGRKRIQMIAESWERQKEVKNIMVFLQEHATCAATYPVRREGRIMWAWIIWIAETIAAQEVCCGQGICSIKICVMN